MLLTSTQVLLSYIKLERSLVSAFGSTNISDNPVSRIKQNKSQFRWRLIAVDFHDVKRTGISKTERNVNYLVEQRQAQISP